MKNCWHNWGNRNRWAYQPVALFVYKFHLKIVFSEYLHHGADLAGLEAERRDCLQERDGV